MTTSSYPVARAAAVRVYRQLAATHARPEAPGGLLPDVETIEAVIDVAFWASLRREETLTPRISLAYVSPAEAIRPMVFEHPVPLAAQPLTRLGPAVERPGIHLCVGRIQSVLVVWGATRNLPKFCFVLEVVAPGLLVIKHSRGDDSGKFVNIAVLQGDEVKILSQSSPDAARFPELFSSLLGHPSVSSEASPNALVQLAVSMRAHGRGGALLVVPGTSQAWRDSILQPITYAVSPSFRVLVDLMREDSEERSRLRWQEALSRVIDGMAGLTAVDGAAIMTIEYELLAFGAKIIRRSSGAQVERVILTEPTEGSRAQILEPGQLGGTRHLSAAQFAHDQPDAMALVASQDGRFTVFGWSPVEAIVHARRIETLLF